MKTLKTFAAKENLLFDYIRTINEDEYNDIYSRYVKMTKKQKENMIEETMNGMIYVNQMPMGEKKPIFYAVTNYLISLNSLKKTMSILRNLEEKLKH